MERSMVQCGEYRLGPACCQAMPGSRAASWRLLAPGMDKGRAIADDARRRIEDGRGRVGRGGAPVGGTLDRRVVDGAEPFGGAAAVNGVVLSMATLALSPGTDPGGTAPAGRRRCRPEGQWPRPGPRAGQASRRCARPRWGRHRGQARSVSASDLTHLKSWHGYAAPATVER